MDPDQTLKDISALIRQWRVDRIDEEDAIQLFEAVDALDSWMSHGGFMPKDWETKKRVKLKK